MKATLSALIIGLLFLSLPAAAAESRTIAVFDFENNSIFERETYAPLSNGLAQVLISELGHVESLMLVERRKLKEILDEIKLQQSGVTDGGYTVRAGTLCGAQYMVFGSFIVDLNEKLRIDIRVVQVESGKTVKAAEVTGKGKDFLTLIKKLSAEIVDSLPVEMTKTEKKFLDEKTHIGMSALMKFSRGLVSEDGGDFETAKQYFREALQDEPDFYQVKEHVLANRDRYLNR
ncbi:hypothetical protein JXO52_08265 [bacterium]|nr:hypothetical protein [bacterium]